MANKGSKVIFVKPSNKYLDKLDYKPLVSFIIPVLNSERTLDRCLHDIVSQDYFPNIEVIIVDGGSTDRSVEIAKRFTTKIYFMKGPLGEARRLGLRKSSGELIALWDSDVYLPNSRWLSESVKTFKGFPRASTLWVRTTVPPDATMMAKAYDYYSWNMMLDFARRGIGFWGGGISMFRMKSILYVGGMTRGVDTGEDFDLAKKLTEKGYEILLYDNPVYHDSHSTLAEIIQKDVRRARNFKKMGLTYSTGIPLNEYIKTTLKVVVLSIKGLFILKKTYLALVPVLVILRMFAYIIVYLSRVL